MKKPTVYWQYEKTGKVYRLEDGNPEYSSTVSVADNKITIKPIIAAVNWDGGVVMVIALDVVYTDANSLTITANTAVTVTGVVSI